MKSQFLELLANKSIFQYFLGNFFEDKWLQLIQLIKISTFSGKISKSSLFSIIQVIKTWNLAKINFPVEPLKVVDRGMPKS